MGWQVHKLGRYVILLCSWQWLIALAATPAAGDGVRHTDSDFPWASAYFETVADPDAIPDNSATTLAQDQKGFLWIGTQNGLLRYDGYRYRKFLHDAEDADSLAGDYVSALWADERLWIGTNSEGLSMYDPARDRFVNFRHDPAQAGSLADNIITAVTGDADGGIWVGTEKGLDYLPPGAKSFVHYRHQSGNQRSLRDNRIRSLMLDRRGRLWVGSEGGLQRFERSSGRFDSIGTSNRDAPSLHEQAVLALFEAQDGKIWLGTRNLGAAFLSADAPQLHFLTADQANLSITRICQPGATQIWLGTTGEGLYVLNAANGQMLHNLRHDAAIANSLAHDDVRALLLDRAGLLWVAAVGGGLQRHNTLNHSFRLLRHSPNLPQSLSHADVRSMLELSDGRLLVALANNGIDIIDRQRGRIGSFQIRAKGKPPRISAMLETRDGSIWLGTLDSGLFRLTRGSSQWQNFSIEQGVPDVLIHTLLESRKGELWVASKRGLAQWQAASQRFVPIYDDGGKSMHESLHALAEDKAGRIWASSHGGLWVLQAGMGLRLIQHEPQRAESLIANRVNGLLIDHLDRLWVDTAQGLERLLTWDGKQADFIHVSAKIGRAARSVGENLMEDEQGRIWTESLVLDPQRMRYHELTKADGLDLGVNWFGAKARTHDGLLLFGGAGGLAIVDPAQFQPWNYQPPIHPTEIKLGGVRQALGAISPVLRLLPEQRDFSIEFSALDFSMPQNLHYRYRLQGYDHDWIETDANHRNASYGNLWPGLYTLQVRATNRIGNWSGQELLIPVRVLPAFWQTGWFLALALLLCASTLYGGYRWRLARLRAKARMLQNLVHTRTSELQATQARLGDAEKMAALGTLVAGIAHELNTPLGTALVAMSGAAKNWERLNHAIASGKMSRSALENNSKEGLELTVLALDTTTRAADLIRTLQSFAIKADTDQHTWLELGGYLQEITALLQERLHHANCRLLLEVQPDLKLYLVSEALTEALGRIFDNCFDHAFAVPKIADVQADGSGAEALLVVRARAEGPNTVVIEVSDNGCGIAASHLPRMFEPFFANRGPGHAGLGLHIAWNQVTQRLTGEIGISSELRQGTCVCIRLPAAAPTHHQ
jgi:ligand-binding sensor domain-containing protein/signal transduction histidine kinase